MVSAYAEAKQAQIDNILAKISKDDDPEAMEIAREFCAGHGVIDNFAIHQLGWLILGYGNRRAKKARKSGK